MKRVLLVSFHFPPFNSIAALRTGKFAKFLTERGWDVRVVASQSEMPQNMPLEVPAESVLYTPWTHIDDRLDQFLRFGRAKVANGGVRERSTATPSAPDTHLSLRSRVRRKLGDLRKAVLHTPDSRITWLPEALREVDAFFGEWSPDTVYASAPPTTTLLVARALAKRYNVPWIAEFRDLWTDNPYYEYPAWRKQFDRVWERRVINDAAALVTVSSIWRDHLRAKFNKPVELAMNGYVPTDFLPGLPVEPSRTGPLHILYTGIIYAGYRDPLPLFEAIAMLGTQREDVLVEFIGTDLTSVSQLATKAGVADRVIVAPPIKYRESLQRQTQADVLLHLQWNDPKESGTISGKLFEYFGARRPVLGLGYDRGEVATLVATQHRGHVINEPARIAEQLRLWIAEKRNGGIKPLSDDAVRGLTRDEQFVNAERTVIDVLNRRIDAKASNMRRRSGLPLDPTGMTTMPMYRPLDTSALGAPKLCVVIDTEEEFDWAAPFSRDNTAVSAVGSLPLVQRLFERFAIRPAYLLDYPIVMSDLGRRLFTDWLKSDSCEIGAHLHAWVNPPHVEDVNVRNSYSGNLPPGLERQKLAVLANEIRDALGVQPLIYKAGRNGMGPSTAATLEVLGFKVDTSVLPHTDMRFKLGPDYRGFSEQAFVFGQDRPMLQLPVTRAFLGAAHRAAGSIFPLVESETRTQSFLRGMLARTHLINRVTLTPEGVDFDQMARLTRELLARGQRLFVLSFHSPSLEAGHTPYVLDQKTRDEFLARVERYLEFFFGEIGGEPTSPLAIHDRLIGNWSAAG